MAAEFIMQETVGLWQRFAIATGWIWIAALNAYLLWQVW